VVGGRGRGGLEFALSQEDVRKETKKLLELEVLGVFLCGAMLEVVREATAERSGAAEERTDSELWGDGGGRLDTAGAVSVMEYVVTCAESVITEGPEALGVSALKAHIPHITQLLL
jgi:hypothetical protein